MLLHRRILLATAAGGTLAAFRPAWAEDITRAERSIGNADAKTVVHEYFSLTCTHCGAFAREVMPKIKESLIDTGKLRWVYHDFPLDRVALQASQVARYLPVDRYDPFIMALFNTQDRWAFARGADPTGELWKMAALAGMSRATFDKAVGDTALQDWILNDQKADGQRFGIDSTPSFVINGQKYAGEMSFDAFRKLIPGES